MEKLPVTALIKDYIKLSPWKPWNQRDSIRNSDEYPGVYLLARFPDGPPRKVNMLSEDIVYVGETVDQTLCARWYQFNRSAFQNKFGHSGGKTYRSIIGGSSRSLFVSAFPVTYDSEIFNKAFIRYVERLLLYNFARQHGDFPKCNRK